MTSFFSADGGPIWIIFQALVQNDISTAVIWSKSKQVMSFFVQVLSQVVLSQLWHWPEYIPWLLKKKQYVPKKWLRDSALRIIKCGGRLGEFHGMSSQSHVSHCRVLPLGEFTVTITKPHAALQGAVTWRNQCYDRTTLQDVKARL